MAIFVFSIIPRPGAKEETIEVEAQLFVGATKAVEKEYPEARIVEFMGTHTDRTGLA